ncbi:hypothetical protein GFY24_38940 [Nocardia sp. SYP-A9097]|uniref:hypothetical protein n=1 Tax=Nocardia sp. SYP-A9097 TaxID=2663237 RepID=UPI00129B4264|nr:hypothetical protein [Nocardia sp. SYP-A9097]MRH93327.1 hypothetical protein [Nocardia sp. SYP-A9097]
MESAVRFWEDPAGMVYLSRASDRCAWPLGEFIFRHLGEAEHLARQWHRGAWTPVNEQSVTRKVSELTWIATWTPSAGLVTALDENDDAPRPGTWGSLLLGMYADAGLEDAFDRKDDADDAVYRAMLESHAHGLSRNEIARAAERFWSRPVTLELITAAENRAHLEARMTAIGLRVHVPNRDNDGLPPEMSYGDIEFRIRRKDRALTCHIVWVGTEDKRRRTAQQAVSLLYDLGHTLTDAASSCTADEAIEQLISGRTLAIR